MSEIGTFVRRHMGGVAMRRTFTCRHCGKPITARMGIGRTTVWVHIPARGGAYYQRCEGTTTAEPEPEGD